MNASMQHYSNSWISQILRCTLHLSCIQHW